MPSYQAKDIANELYTQELLSQTNSDATADDNTNSVDLQGDGNEKIHSGVFLISHFNGNASDDITWTLNESSDDSTFSAYTDRNGNNLTAKITSADAFKTIELTNENPQRYVRLESPASDQTLGGTDVDQVVVFVGGGQTRV